MSKPKIIGLTGSIGMGKSTVAAMFAEAGIPVFDADAEVRAMQGPGGELIPAIEAAFPGSTGPEGVDRDRLGHQVFADKAALACRLSAASGLNIGVWFDDVIHPAGAFRHGYVAGSAITVTVIAINDADESVLADARTQIFLTGTP